MRRIVLSLALVAACRQPASDRATRPPPQPKAGAVTISIIGTNDLHGALERLPMLAGYIGNLRAAREVEGGGVVLVDAGDMFQGTLESNIAEGADVVAAYNAIGYHAAVVGNHEFDYGPEGPAVIAATVEDDPRGALKKRASEAKFPLLVTNIFDAKSKSRIKWPNMVASTVVTVAGIKVGIVGATTESTPFTTMPANFAGLEIAKPAKAIADEAAELRKQGVQIIVVTAHIGSKCKDLSQPNDHSSCDKNEELFSMISDLPRGTVDVIVAGHTHAAIAHRIDDIAVIESYASGRAFGRVDLRISPDGRVTGAKVLPPTDLCPRPPAAGGRGSGAGEDRDAVGPVPIDECRPPAYEGKPVIPDPTVQTIVDAALAKADTRRKEKLGATLPKPITKSYGTESAEGNWFCDLMLAAQPGTDVALTNGGGLRADIPAGDLTYGKLFEAMPFDNRFALVELTGAHIRKLVTTNLQRGGGIFSWGGVTARARCAANKLAVTIWVNGKPLDDGKKYKLVTSDFIASGGDGIIGRLKLPDGSVKLTDVIIRDAIADLIRKKGGTSGGTGGTEKTPYVIDAATLLNPQKKRLDYEGERPVSCGVAPGGKSTPPEPD